MKLNLALAVLSASFSVSSGFTVGPKGSFTPVETRSSWQRYGILDEVNNSDAYNLLGNVDESDNSSEIEAAYETFLAQIVFSANDPRLEIIDNIELSTDPKWLAWLENKANNSRDVEEKMALKDLKNMIDDILRKIEVSKATEERQALEEAEAEAKRLENAEAEAEVGRAMSDADVLRKANAVDRSGLGSAADGEKAEKKSFLESELTPEIRMSYDDLCKKVLPPYKPGESSNSIVFSYYDQFDAQFIKLLTERAANGEVESQDVLDALAVEQQKRIATATESIKSIISLGEPMRMEGAIVKLARDGKIDEPFLLLLEANANQAAAAGANGPAELMRKLGKRANEEKDKQSSTKEVKLLRKLLRADDASERETLLVDAFTPKQGLLVEGSAANVMKAADGELPEEEKPVPEVPPPDFINACKAVLLNFGNLSTDDDRGDLSSRIKQIAAEAEVVATRIYGKGMSAREQQDRMWKEQSTSIFDLETLEIEAERRGDTAPWANSDNNDILPGFDASGKMKIGGQ